MAGGSQKRINSEDPLKGFFRSQTFRFSGVYFLVYSRGESSEEWKVDCVIVI